MAGTGDASESSVPLNYEEAFERRETRERP